MPALSLNEEQAIFTFSKLLGGYQLGFLMTRVIEELSAQIAVTWGITMACLSPLIGECQWREP